MSTSTLPHDQPTAQLKLRCDTWSNVGCRIRKKFLHRGSEGGQIGISMGLVDRHRHTHITNRAKRWEGGEGTRFGTFKYLKVSKKRSVSQCFKRTLLVLFFFFRHFRCRKFQRGGKRHVLKLWGLEIFKTVFGMHVFEGDLCRSLSVSYLF